MPKYITRIELLDAVETDYEKLDLEFGKQSFYKATVKAGQSVRVGKLKEYYREGNVNLQLVTASVYNTAKKIGKKFTFTVIKDKGNYPLAIPQ